MLEKTLVRHMNTINKEIKTPAPLPAQPAVAQTGRRLFAEAENIRHGLSKHGTALGLQSFAGPVQGLLDSARVADGAYETSVAGERLALRSRAQADYLALRFILAVRNVCKRTGPGIQSGDAKMVRCTSDAVPETALERAVLLNHWADFFQARSREEPASLWPKAGNYARALHQRLARAFNTYSAARRQRQEWGMMQQRTAKALRRYLESVVAVLHEVLPAWDERWTDFGFAPKGCRPPEGDALQPWLALGEKTAEPARFAPSIAAA